LKGANVNAKDKNRRTALYWMVRNGGGDCATVDAMTFTANSHLHQALPLTLTLLLYVVSISFLF
jgi:hypothetical protein